MSTLDKREPDKEPDNFVLSYVMGEQFQPTIADMVLEILHQDREDELSINDLILRIKKTYNRPLAKETLRKICSRLFTDDKIKKIKKGHFTFYQIKLSQDEHMEMIFEKTIQGGNWEPPKYHKVTLLFKIDQQDKSRGTPLVPKKTLQNTMNPNSISYRWNQNVPDWSKKVPISGGFQELISYNGYNECYQIFFNGTFQIFIESTYNPLDFVSWFHHYEYQKGVFHSRCGNDLDDFQDLIDVRFEMAEDTSTGRSISNDSSGKYCLTLRQFKTMARVYIKQIGDTEIIRREVGNEEDFPLTNFIQENVAMLHGGLNSQVFIRQWYETNKRLEQQAKVIEDLGNAVKFLMRERNKAKRPQKAATMKPKKAKVPGGCFCP